MPKTVKQHEEDAGVSKNGTLKVSTKVHPEELSVGDAVVVSEVTYQYPSFLWCGVDPVTLPPQDAVSIKFKAFDAEPLIVKAICLPYVVCQPVKGEAIVYDLRLAQLVKLDAQFAKTARAALEGKPKKKRKSKKKGKGKSKSKKA